MDIDKKINDKELSYFQDKMFVKSENVQSELNQLEEEKSIPRRNGLFSITENLKVHRYTSSGKSLSIQTFCESVDLSIILTYYCCK